MTEINLIAAGAEFWPERAKMASLEVDDPLYDDKFERLAQSLGKLEDNIMATPATDPAGIAVKLRIALDHAEAALPNEPGDIGEHPLGMAITSALHDAERLAAE